MKQLEIWQCSCNAYNAPSLIFCASCGETKHAGTPKKAVSKRSSNHQAMSTLEADFWRRITKSDIPEPKHEWRFDYRRRWRFDFAWPSVMLAVELEGGVWSRGRHTRGAGYIADTEKYNKAVELGWRVLRYASVDTACIEQVERVYNKLIKEQAA